eukprot:GHRQ01025940.1.p3 GENE.GHRQ01025940.1~~GHRQ01025940.1.p3  ORF type:complete len:116 (-),score=22.88 GHRQ01025940.1:613-960(-)
MRSCQRSHLQDPSIKQMAEQIANDPSFQGLTSQLQESMSGMMGAMGGAGGAEGSAGPAAGGMPGMPGMGWLVACAVHSAGCLTGLLLAPWACSFQHHLSMRDPQDVDASEFSMWV